MMLQNCCSDDLRKVSGVHVVWHGVDASWTVVYFSNHKTLKTEQTECKIKNLGCRADSAAQLTVSSEVNYLLWAFVSSSVKLWGAGQLIWKTMGRTGRAQLPSKVTKAPF